MTPNTIDHQKDAVNRLPLVFKEIEDMRQFVKVLTKSHNLIETECRKIIENFNIAAGTGFILDLIGKHLILEREGITDDEQYRNKLYSRYIELQRSGEPETLIELYKLLTGADQIEYTDRKKLVNLLAAFEVTRTMNKDEIVELLKSSKQGGQGLELYTGERPEFRLPKDEDNSEFNSENGCNSGKLLKTIY
jgi:hypothetical protein